MKITVNFRLADKCPACGSGNMTAKPALISPFIVERISGVKNTAIRCRTVTCKDCETEFQDIRYSDEQMQKIYADYRDEAYIAMRAWYEDGYRDMNEWFSRRVPYMDKIEEIIKPYVTLPVSVLDWGGDTGINAPFEHDRTLLHIYDIGSNPVVPGAVRVDFPDAMPYDVVVCANVLEHVPDPVDTLIEVAKSMDDHSVLYLEMPAKDKDIFWSEHINYFSGAGLDAMIDRAGLVTLFGGLAQVVITDRTVLQYMMVCKKGTR